MQPAMPAEAERVTNREIMIAENREHPQRGAQVAEELRRSGYVPVALVDEVTGERDQVGLRRGGALDDLFQVTGRNVRAAVKVSELGHSQPRELCGQATDAERQSVDRQPQRFDVVRVTEASPGAADNASHATEHRRARRDRREF